MRSRWLHPVAVGMVVSGCVLGWVNLITGGALLTGYYMDIIGWVSVLYALLLTLGIILGNMNLLRWGLILACGAWVGRATFAITQSGFDHFGVYLSLGWALIAGGSSYLEIHDPGGRYVRSQ